MNLNTYRITFFDGESDTCKARTIEGAIWWADRFGSGRSYSIVEV